MEALIVFFLNDVGQVRLLSSFKSVSASHVGLSAKSEACKVWETKDKDPNSLESTSLPFRMDQVLEMSFRPSTLLTVMQLTVD